MMFEATLKNGSCPEHDPVAVEFPIPEDRYEETIRALEAIRIGRADKQDCRIEEVFSANCPGLVRLIGTMANVDELDWLSKQLEAFDEYELLQFQGAAERFELQNVEEWIDLTGTLQPETCRWVAGNVFFHTARHGGADLYQAR